MGVVLNGLTAAAGQAVASVEIGDLITITKSYSQGAPGTVTKTMYVEQISHNITANSHTVSLGLGQAQLLTYFILDTSQLDDADVGLG
jgi:hypothetical protein